VPRAIDFGQDARETLAEQIDEAGVATCESRRRILGRRNRHGLERVVDRRRGIRHDERRHRRARDHIAVATIAGVIDLAQRGTADALVMNE
jgi:hypothetical protein